MMALPACTNIVTTTITKGPAQLFDTFLSSVAKIYISKFVVYIDVH